MKLERFFLSRAPVLKEVLDWTKQEDLDETTQDSFNYADRMKFNDEDVTAANASIWRSLIGGISRVAAENFKRG